MPPLSATILADLSPLRTALLLAVPMLYLLVAASTAVPGAARPAPWRFARWAAGAAVAAALLSLLGLLAGGPALLRGPTLLNLGDLGALRLGLRADAAGLTLLLLASALGGVIVAYSHTALAGERGQRRYLRRLALTLAAVSLLAVANNLLLLAATWVGTSLALHGLLTFYRERPAALIAAHKKFIASRAADLCLLAAIALLAHTLGTLEIDEATTRARAMSSAGLPPALQAAALLIAICALLKCAQLPLHGWLLQVMEAPTPVSALLHAGVVNLGGFLLIRLGSLVADVPAAQTLLVVVGSITAVVAAGVTMTRISIKLALAWSTCAQMGFMLLQCGLGLHSLALMHLVGHSIYKAHAFLGAGGAVADRRRRQLSTPPPAAGLLACWLGALAGAAIVTVAGLAFGLRPAEAPGLWAMGGVLALALAPLLTRVSGSTAVGLWRLAGPAAAIAVTLAYFGLHALFERWLGPSDLGAATHPALVIWILACFGALFALQVAVRARPESALARRLHPLLFAGLHLDERFTRWSFRLWPLRLPASAPQSMAEPGRTPPSTTPGAC